ncbi:MAG: polyisoprenoid-binding protein [Rhodobacteraceae bacterium]|nr:polyisoprenoid-binding protein [Paracoccaceae bacterium]
MRALSIIILLLFALSAPAISATWEIVPHDTRVEVDVNWLGRIVTLRFDRIHGTILFDRRRPERARAQITVDARAVSTGLAVVDAFVRGPDYLNVGAYPTIGFQLDRLVRTSPSTADVFGRLTLFGTTRSVSLQAQVFRYGPTPGAPQRFDAGFDLTGTVDRRDFGHTTGLPQIAATLPIRIRLLMRSL